MCRLLSTLLAILILGLSAPGIATADGLDKLRELGRQLKDVQRGEERPEIRRRLIAERTDDRGVSLGEAVEQVRKRYGGRVVSAKTRSRDGREVHVIKVLSDNGRVRTVEIAGRAQPRAKYRYRR